MKLLILISVVGWFVAAALHAAEPVRVSVEGEKFVADFFYLEESSPRLGILLLGGSEGGKPVYRAQALAKQGYAVLAVGYFGFEGTSQYLDLVPLEYFDDAIAWLQRRPEVKPGGIAVFGVSKGAELALVLASRRQAIIGAIAVAPSSVVWQSLTMSLPPRSSWKEGGAALPFVPYDVSRGWHDIVTLYRHSLEQVEAVEKAAIKVENIGGPILLLSGSDDTIWPAAEMSERIAVRLKEVGFSHFFENVVYPDAGHILTEHYIMGGTAEGNKAARLDSSARIAAFLSTLEQAEKKISP